MKRSWKIAIACCIAFAFSSQEILARGFAGGAGISKGDRGGGGGQPGGKSGGGQSRGGGGSATGWRRRWAAPCRRWWRDRAVGVEVN